MQNIKYITEVKRTIKKEDSDKKEDSKKKGKRKLSKSKLKLKEKKVETDTSKIPVEPERFKLYKIDVNPNFTKLEIKNMVESLFNVQVLKVNTSRRYRPKRSLLNQLSPAPQVLKRAFVKTEPKDWKLQKKIDN